MDFAHWGQIPNGFNFDLLSNDEGCFWTPEIDTGRGLESGDHSGRHYSTESTESTTGSQQSSSNFSTAEFSQSQEYDKLAKSDRVDEDGSGGSKGLGRPRYAVQISRDTAMNRIQRRRIQNRNSQRIYRQRRVEERHKFETRALAAEKTSEELRVHLGELNAMICSLKHQVEHLEAENAALRRCSH